MIFYLTELGHWNELQRIPQIRLQFLNRIFCFMSLFKLEHMFNRWCFVFFEPCTIGIISLVETNFTRGTKVLSHWPISLENAAIGVISLVETLLNKPFFNYILQRISKRMTSYVNKLVSNICRKWYIKHIISIIWAWNSRIAKHNWGWSEFSLMLIKKKVYVIFDFMVCKIHRKQVAEQMTPFLSINYRGLLLV